MELALSPRRLAWLKGHRIGRVQVARATGGYHMLKPHSSRGDESRLAFYPYAGVASSRFECELASNRVSMRRINASRKYTKD